MPLLLYISFISGKLQQRAETSCFKTSVEEKERHDLNNVPALL